MALIQNHRYLAAYATLGRTGRTGNVRQRTQEPPAQIARVATDSASRGSAKASPDWHPPSWHGWLILAVVVTAIVAVLVPLRTGLS